MLHLNQFSTPKLPTKNKRYAKSVEKVQKTHISQWVINLVIRPGHQTKIGPVKYQNGVQKRI